MSDSKQTSESIKCVVRCRPLNDKEKTLATKCISISPDSKVIFVDNKDEKNKLAQTQYAMDKIFDEDVTQEQLFNEIGIPLLNNFLSAVISIGTFLILIFVTLFFSRLAISL